MSKNPIINGLSALVYIILVASIMNIGSQFARHPNPFIAPIAFLSLFTLSAALMGYIFCFEPLQLYLDGKKKQAVNLFVQTLLVFGVFTILLFVLLFIGVFS